MDDLNFILIMLVVAAAYFTPTIIAFSREHEYRAVILALNIVAAWTGLVWAGILVWAVWPAEKSLADPFMGNVTGRGARNVGDTLGSVEYGRERGYRGEKHRSDPIDPR